MGQALPNKREQTSYSRRPDERVVLLAQDGDGVAIDRLLQKYKSVVLFKSRSYFLHGADRDDMIQEGMIGLFKAIRDFRPDRGCSFRTFANICIKRQMISAVKTGNGKKQGPHIYASSLDERPRDDDEPRVDIFADKVVPDPEQSLITREANRQLRALLRRSFSQIEWAAFTGRSKGKSYKEIAEEQGSTPKSVDNALCRVRRKIEKIRTGAMAVIGN